MCLGVDRLGIGRVSGVMVHSVGFGARRQRSPITSSRFPGPEDVTWSNFPENLETSITLLSFDL